MDASYGNGDSSDCDRLKSFLLFSPISCQAEQLLFLSHLRTLPWSTGILGKLTIKDRLGGSSSSNGVLLGGGSRLQLPKGPVLMQVGEDTHRPLWKQQAQLLGSSLSEGGARSLGSFSPASHGALG